jgi:hypothetical protein
MSIEDPGWGDYVPLPEEEGKEPAGKTGGSPPGSGPPSQPPRAPWWQSRSGIAVGVGAAALVVIIAVMALGGGGGDPPPNPGPSGSFGPSGAPTTPGPGNPTEAFQATANQICFNHRPAILNAFQAFNATGDPSGLIPALQALQLELQGLGPAPADVGANTYMDDFGRWIQTFQEHDFAGAQVWQSAMATHSLEAGLQNCPPN